MAALGLLAVVSWVLIIVLGAGSGDPIWQAARGCPRPSCSGRLVLAVLIGLAPLVVTAAASWATARGFREDAGRPFWTITQSVWGLAAVGLVVLDRSRAAWLEELGFSTLDWWFAFGVVAFAMIVAGVRLRRAPRAPGR